MEVSSHLSKGQRVVRPKCPFCKSFTHVFVGGGDGTPKKSVPIEVTPTPTQSSIPSQTTTYKFDS